jgi:hypothetical protein
VTKLELEDVVLALTLDGPTLGELEIFELLDVLEDTLDDEPLVKMLLEGMAKELLSIEVLDDRILDKLLEYRLDEELQVVHAAAVPTNMISVTPLSVVKVSKADPTPAKLGAQLTVIVSVAPAGTV